MSNFSIDRIGDFLKIAQERFDDGKMVAYIPLWGDPERNHNFAGIWITRNQSHYSHRLTGRLLGQNVLTEVSTSPTLEDAIRRVLKIWDAYAA